MYITAMTRPCIALLQRAAAIVLMAAGVCFSGEMPVVFMEPSVTSDSAGSLPLYRIIDDSSRVSEYLSWLDNAVAAYALELYDEAREIMQESVDSCLQPPEFYIALVPGGNHADVGFRLERPDGTTSFPQAAYIKLEPKEWRFDITLLHETGHVVVRLFSCGEDLPGLQIASIPHSTAALTDRATAFDEGFAIHLETFIIHLSDDQHIRNKYRHEQSLFGTWPGFLAEYYRQSSDLMSYSQSVARYYCIRENTFAFQSACREPDYLRVQLDKERDYSELRNANQLLQSEGFCGSFFFSLMAQGKSLPTEELISERRHRMLAALLRTVSNKASLNPDTPHLVRFVDSYRKLFPEEEALIIDILLDLSHGVFIDANAEEIWREHYLSALRLEQDMDTRAKIEEIRDRWRSDALADFQALYGRLGPQIVCTIPHVLVGLRILEQTSPVSFDVNTAQPGIIRLIPGISQEEVQSWTEERQKAPFTGIDDFISRAGLQNQTLEHLSFAPAP